MNGIRILIFSLMTLLMAGVADKTPRITSTERARLAYQNYSVDSILVGRMKLLRVLRIMQYFQMEVYGTNLFKQADKLNLKDEKDQQVFDSLVEHMFLAMDLMKNPDTPENEFREDLLKRMQYCDEHFEKWWEDYDLRAYVAIQLGIDGLIYTQPYENFCRNSIGDTALAGICENCQMSYPSRGIYIQLQRRLGLDNFDMVVAWEERKPVQQMLMPSSGKIEPGSHLALKFKEAADLLREEITVRKKPPAYNPLPESKKEIQATWRLFQRQIDKDKYEIWTIVALPYDQFTRNPQNIISFETRQVIRALDSAQSQIIANNRIISIAAEYQDEMQDGFYFAATRQVLGAGRWKFVMVPSEGKNKSIYTMNATIPNRALNQGLSDILLFINQETGQQVQIENERFTALPFAAFRKEHTLNALVCTYNIPDDSLLVTWYLRPIKKDPSPGAKPKDNSKFTSPQWVRWHGEEFPVLKFLNPDDIVLDFQRAAGLPIYKLQYALMDIPKGEYELNCLVVDPLLSGITRESSLWIKIN